MRRLQHWGPLLMLAPLLLLLGGLFLGGLVFGLLQSVGLLRLVEGQAPGLRWYGELLRSPAFVRSLLLTAYVGAVSTLLAAGLGVAFALLLRQMARHGALLRLLVQLPVPVPHLVAALGSALLLAQSGLLARMLYALGLISAPAEMPALIYDRGAVGIMLTYVWKEAPFLTLVTLATLGSRGDELELAARTLGASRWQALVAVTLPLIAPALLRGALIVFAFISGAFEVPLLLGQSYPRMLAVEAFQRYQAPDLAMRPAALALSTLIAIFTVLAVFPFLWLIRRSALPAGGPQQQKAS